RGGRVPGPDGQPVYGPRDEPELAKFRALGLPFWLAGERASPERLAEARALGAVGVQVGTAFAFCAESGLDPDIKTRVCAQSRAGRVHIFTDPHASPTGFPFKVLALSGTLSEPEVYDAHPRRCDLGYLRETYTRADGSLGYRCPAEPVEDYVAKGGAAEACVGRKCLCNGLLAAIGLGQLRPGATFESPPSTEPAIVTAGQETTEIARFLAPDAAGYSARDVLAHILGPLPASPGPLAPAPEPAHH
ncbi:MAG: nitronate monooxygenase, partial [Burkholderiales bacterium]|nr:nitronate monooxygenase [Opitutaceae bacterium]